MLDSQDSCLQIRACVPWQLFGLLKHLGGATQLSSGLETKGSTVYPAFPNKIQGLVLTIVLTFAI